MATVEDPNGEVSRLRKLTALVLALFLAGAGAWIVATKVESPEQVAARAEAPRPDPIVAPLRTGFLNGSVTLSTTAQLERTVAVKPPTTMTGVVTFVGKSVGDVLTPGSALLRANGRPVFVLPAAFPLYRNLQPGDVGDDVAAIQEGLRAAGHGTGRDRSGTYGAGTQAAVRAMYRAAGYAAPEKAADEAPEAAPNPGPAPTAAPAPSSSSTSETASPPAAATPVGPLVLTSEVLTIADLPSVVQAISPVGTELSSESDLVTLGAGPLGLTATLPTTSIGALAVGAEGVFTDDAGQAGTARVLALTEKTDTAETVVSMTPTGAVTPGGSYVVSIENPAAETGETLLAPVAAVVSRASRSYLYVRDGDTFQEVEVQVVGSVGGVAGVAPVDTAVPLSDGTEVRIG